MVDVLTDKIRLSREGILQATGQPLDPVIVRGQIEGAFMQAAGRLTMDELVWPIGGKLLTDSPAACKIPTAADMPKVFNVLSVQPCSNRVEALFQSKGIDETPLLLAIYGHRAIGQALQYTLRSGAADGSRLDTSATPENILTALEGACPVP